MKKYLVPCVALAGIALLTPRVDAATLTIKSRVAAAGHAVHLPVSVSAVSVNQLWGIDFGLTFDATKVTATNAAAAFVPFVTSTSDVVVTGNTFVGGGTQPNLYVGYVKGQTGVDTTKALGSLALTVTAGVARSTVVVLTVPATYNVKNDGTGADVSRAGATGVTSTATAGDPVVAETVTLGDAGAANVPQHRVGVGTPGDVTGDGNVNVADVSNLAAFTAGKVTFTDYKKIAADVSPLNGYTPANIGGTTGVGYGDGIINVGDLALLKQKVAGVVNANTTNFPVSE